MSPERYQKVNDLFREAIALTPNARPAFLQSSCAADPEALREVVEMLEEHERIQTPLITDTDDLTKFIPREQVAPSGFMRVLSWFGAFNYAIAGSVNAAINLAQGEDEEINPLTEFYRGFTTRDLETFSDVFENLARKHGVYTARVER